LPCQHVLKIAISYEISIIELIDKFWLIDSLACYRHGMVLGKEKIRTHKINIDEYKKNTNQGSMSVISVEKKELEKGI
jgi:hypothetical protein